MKKLFLSILTVLLPMVAFADAVEIDGIYYDLNPIGKTAEVARNPNEYKGDVVIPASVAYDGTDYSVTFIGYAAFKSCSDLTSVTIPSSVKLIRPDAFYYCSALCSVNIPDQITTIEANTFYWCYSLTSITIPNSVRSIHEMAFFGCSSLATVTLGSSVKYIQPSAFGFCTAITNVYCLAEDAPVIANAVFELNTIEKAILHVPASSIEAYKAMEPWMYFKDIIALNTDAVEIDGIYYNLKTDTNKAEVTNLLWGNYAGSLDIPASVTYDGVEYCVSSIGDFAFLACSNLTSISIPGSVTSIGYEGFSGCRGLTSISIPNSVKSIGIFAFTGCRNLDSVSFSDIASWCSIDFASNTSNPLCNGGKFYVNGELIEDLVIPNGVTSIGDYSFNNCGSITSVTLSNSVTSIGEESFGGCSNLKSITIPNSMENIDDSAFNDCTNLHDVYISDIASWCSIDFASYTSNPLYYGGNLYVNGELIEDLVIPNSVTSIGKHAFNCCFSLTSVTIPGSVTSLDELVFYNCRNMVSATIGDGVTSIEYGTFSYCRSLSSVTIPNSVVSIGGYAFLGCSSLGSIVIPNSVDSIKYGAFTGCSSLVSVTIPNSVTFVDDFAFTDCSALTTVTIGSSVKEIGTIAFRNCPALADVYCLAEEVPTTAIDAFQNSPVENATLHVPASAVEAYKAAEPWNGFKDIVPLEGESIETTYYTSSTGRIDIYSIDGKLIGSAADQSEAARIINNLPSGTSTIVKKGGKSVKVVVR